MRKERISGAVWNEESNDLTQGLWVWSKSGKGTCTECRKSDRGTQQKLRRRATATIEWHCSLGCRVLRTTKNFGPSHPNPSLLGVKEGRRGG